LLPPIKFDDLPDDVLDALNLYHGFPCLHGHTVRNKDKHWCYECALNIQANRCGFDINYLEPLYWRRPYIELLNNLKINSSAEPWYYKDNRRRIGFYSHRSLGKENMKDNVSIHKLIYQLAWGDVGSLSVTRIHPDRNTVNPLHLKSYWNRFAYPREIHPFEPKFNWEKILQAHHVSPNEIMESQYKNTIQHPLEVSEELPAYHEDE